MGDACDNRGDVRSTGTSKRVKGSLWVMVMTGLGELYKQIERIAAEEGASRLVLFGSRARGTERPKSDIDLAVEGCPNFGKLWDRLQEEPHSLLNIDVVDLDSCGSDSLRADIERDGKVLFEKVG